VSLKPVQQLLLCAPSVLLGNIKLIHSRSCVHNEVQIAVQARFTMAAALRRYGKFGYGFGRGSYNISAQQYADAVAAVVSAPLASIAADFGALLRQEPMPALLQHYSAAGEVEGQAGFAFITTFSLQQGGTHAGSSRHLRVLLQHHSAAGESHWVGQFGFACIAAISIQQGGASAGSSRLETEG
jgi:hypothetical protein